MEVRLRDLVAVAAHALDRRADRAVGRAPAEHERVGAVGVVDRELGDVVRDPGHLRRAQARHQVVVLGVVGDRAGHVGLLEPADPVLEPGRAGNRPRPRERLGVARVRHELALADRRELGRDVRQVLDLRDQPRLGAVREVGVREQVDGRAVLERDPRRLDRGVEALRRRRGREHRHRALGVAPEEHHQQVGLLRLRRHPRRGAGALDVEDQQRQLEHDPEPDRLRLEHDPRAGGGGDAERAAERRAERGADGGDLVLGLEGADAEALVPRQLLEDRARGRDRVRAEEEVEPGQLRGGDQPVGERGVAGDLAVDARGQLRRRDLVADREVLRGLAVRVAGLERGRVRLRDLGPLAELLLDELERPLGGPVVEPAHQPEREEVLRALGLARGDPLDPLQRLDRHRGQRDLVHVVVGERAVLERVRLVAGLLQVALLERVGVDDQRAALGQVLHVRAQRGRVHRHEHVRRVAGREDVVVGEVELEAGDARERACRRADLGREVGQRREVVPHHRGLAREAVAGELHPVARVAREADDHALELLDGFCHALVVSHMRDARNER